MKKLISLALSLVLIAALFAVLSAVPAAADLPVSIKLDTSAESGGGYVTQSTFTTDHEIAGVDFPDSVRLDNISVGGSGTLNVAIELVSVDSVSFNVILSVSASDWEAAEPGVYGVVLPYVINYDADVEPTNEVVEIVAEKPDEDGNVPDMPSVGYVDLTDIVSIELELEEQPDGSRSARTKYEYVTRGFIVESYTTDESVTLTNGNGGELAVGVSSDLFVYNTEFGDLEFVFTVSAGDWENAPAGQYTGELRWLSVEEMLPDDNVSPYTRERNGTITLTAVKEEEPEESSEESSGESSEPEESSEVEESSEAEESSEESSKPSKPRNPGKPDEVYMGGSAGGTDGGKVSPDTGFGNAPLIALGVAAMAGLAVLAFRKK